MGQEQSRRSTQASRRLYATSNSKRMINIMHVDDEEALEEGIESMMVALQGKDNEPIITEVQAPAQWQALAAEYSNEAAALHPFSMAPRYCKSRKIPIEHPREDSFTMRKCESIYQRMTSNNFDSLTKPTEEPTLQQQTDCGILHPRQR